MKYRFLLVSILALIPTLIPAFGQTGIYSYDGGYFLRNGSHWEEYRPDYKTGVWASYEQYNEEANFFNIKNSACSVSVPKTASANFFYAKPGEDWPRYIPQAKSMIIYLILQRTSIAIKAAIS